MGHCGLAAALFLVGKYEYGLCDSGSAETVKRVIMNYRKYTRERKEMYGGDEGGAHMVSLRILLQYRDHQRGVTRVVIKILFVTGLYL